MDQIATLARVLGRVNTDLEPGFFKGLRINIRARETLLLCPQQRGAKFEFKKVQEIYFRKKVFNKKNEVKIAFQQLIFKSSSST